MALVLAASRLFVGRETGEPARCFDRYRLDAQTAVDSQPSPGAAIRGKTPLSLTMMRPE